MGTAGLRLTAGFVLGLGVHACQAAAFECTSDSSCVYDDIRGTCQATGYCSFPDGSCPSGQRYGDQGRGVVAGECVPIDEAAGTGTSGSPDATADDDSLSSEDSLDSMGAATTSGAADSASLDGDADGPGEASDDGLDEGQDGSTTGSNEGFFDDFERADGTELGNGWIEKRPTAWQLVGGQVVFESSAASYEDNVFLRPFEEALVDVAVAIEFDVDAVSSDNHPQVHARIQPDVEIPGVVTCYLAFVEGTNLEISRQIDGEFTVDWSAPLVVPLQVGGRYRLTLEVQGTDPVFLHAELLRLDAFELTSVEASDPDEARITAPGSTGASGADAQQLANWRYDNFSWVPL